MFKKTLLTAGAIIIIFIAGAFGWYFFSPQTFPLTKLFSSNTTKDTPQGDEKNFFPFGSGEGTNSSQTNGEASASEQTTSQTEEASFGPLQKISDSPISGFGLFEDKKDGLFVLYSERETGHIWKAFLGGGGKERISNTTIPRVYESVFLDEKHILFRYLANDDKTIESFLGTLTFATTTAGEKMGSIDGIFLKKNILAVSKSPVNSSFFFLTKTDSGSDGYISSSDGKKQAKIFSSETDEWLPVWIKESEIILTTKPSSKEAGYVFALNPKTGSFKKLSAGGLGLTASLGGEGKTFISAGGRGPTLALYDEGKNSVIPSPFKTLAEKCAWSRNEKGVYFCATPKDLPKGEYPDSWYQGAIHFSDEIWKINLKTNETNLSFSSEVPMDIENITLSSKDDFTVFRNKNDLLLYKATFTK
ncbi:MAG: hypothetical protein AAB545_03440 [Patescibacteria group bacterium]